MPDSDDIFGFDGDDSELSWWSPPDREPRDIAHDDQLSAALRDLVDELLPQLREVEAALRRRGRFAQARRLCKVLAWMEDIAFVLITEGMT